MEFIVCPTCNNYLDSCDCYFDNDQEDFMTADLQYFTIPQTDETKGECLAIWHPTVEGHLTTPRSKPANAAQNLELSGFSTSSNLCAFTPHTSLSGMWPSVRYFGRMTAKHYSAEVCMGLDDNTFIFAVIYFDNAPTIDDVRQAVQKIPSVTFDTIAERNSAERAGRFKQGLRSKNESYIGGADNFGDNDNMRLVDPPPNYIPRQDDDVMSVGSDDTQPFFRPSFLPNNFTPILTEYSYGFFNERFFQGVVAADFTPQYPSIVYTQINTAPVHNQPYECQVLYVLNSVTLNNTPTNFGCILLNPNSVPLVQTLRFNKLTDDGTVNCNLLITSTSHGPTSAGNGITDIPVTCPPGFFIYRGTINQSFTSPIVTRTEFRISVVGFWDPTNGRPVAKTAVNISSVYSLDNSLTPQGYQVDGSYRFTNPGNEQTRVRVGSNKLLPFGILLVNSSIVQVNDANTTNPNCAFGLGGTTSTTPILMRNFGPALMVNNFGKGPGQLTSLVCGLEFGRSVFYNPGTP